MFTVIMIFLLFASIFMVAIVLLQPGKADIGATFGGIGSQMGTLFGASKTKNILATATKWCAIIMMILVLATNKYLVGGGPDSQVQKIVTEGQAVNMQAAPASQAPVAAPNANQQQQPAKK